MKILSRRGLITINVIYLILMWVCYFDSQNNRKLYINEQQQRALYVFENAEYKAKIIELENEIEYLENVINELSQ